MKAIAIVLLFILTVALTIMTCVYITEEFLSAGRYQIVFGQILHTASEPSDEPNIKLRRKSEEVICFKLDTATGKTWRYVSDFYEDTDRIIETKGFEVVAQDYAIYSAQHKENNSFVDDSPIDFNELRKVNSKKSEEK